MGRTLSRKISYDNLPERKCVYGAYVPEEARERLDEVKANLAKSTDEKMTAALNRQIEMLMELIEKMEAKDPDTLTRKRIGGIAVTP